MRKLFFVFAIGMLLASGSLAIGHPSDDYTIHSSATIHATSSDQNSNSSTTRAKKFSARLSGSEEVPSVATDMSGKASFKLNKNHNEMRFKLSVKNGDNVTQAHLHCAPKGENGPVVAFLFGNIPGGFDVNGTLAAFTLTGANIVETATTCKMPINSFSDLIYEMEEGRIYVNVHTVDHPNGEIRGQLQ